MATIPVGGLATGLDTNGLVDKLMAVDRQSITALQTKRLKTMAQSTALLDLNSRILNLKTRADAVGDPATFFSRSVTSSTATVATASAGPGGSQGSYTLTVTALARGSIAIAGAPRAAVTDTVASGAGTFQFKLGTTGSTVSIPVDATTTLDGLTRAINDKNSGVRASMVNTGTSALPAWKITLASNNTGASNDIMIGNDDTTLDIANSQTALDAAFSLSGLGDFTRATNTFSDVLDGVTITLKAGTGTTDLVVDLDKAATQNRVQGLLDAYNDVVKAIDGQSAAAVGTDGKVTTGAFTGDAATRQIRRGLSATIAQRFDGAFQALAAIGVTTQRDGTLTLDATKFQQAVSADAPGVRQLVAGAGTGDGIADLLSKAAAAATRSASGAIAIRQGAISASMASAQKDIDRAQARLEVTERGLRTRFASLESLVSQLTAKGSALQSQLDGMANNNSSSRK